MNRYVKKNFVYNLHKNRTTLVIDEERSINNKNSKEEDMFVHREAIHTKKKDYEEILPNPDPSDPNPMYIGKRVRHDSKSRFEKDPLPWKYPK